MVGGDGYVDVGDVVLGGGEAGCIVDSLAACAWGFISRSIAMVLADDQEPGYSERRRICCVDDAIQYVECRKRQAMKRRLRPDVWSEYSG